MIHWCWRCGHKYDPESIMFGDICPECGISQKPKKNRGKPTIPKENPKIASSEGKPRFFNIKITGIATNNAKEETP